jgi:polyadenylate-binding protein
VYGPVSSVLIQRDEHGHSKGFGFVNFEHPEDAEKAVQGLHDVDFHGKRLFVSRAQKKSEREDELRRHHEASRADKKYHGVNLYVKNLAENVTDDLLKQEFSNYGLITSAKVMKDEKVNLLHDQYTRYVFINTAFIDWTIKRFWICVL